MPAKYSAIFLINFFNLFFPTIGLYLNLSFYFFKSKINDVEKKFIFSGILYSLCFLGYLYTRINGGDLLKLNESFLNYKHSLNFSRSFFIEDIYEFFYPTWYFIFYIVSKLNFSMQFVNILACLFIYGTTFYVILETSKRYNNKPFTEKNLILKSLLFISFVVLMSSYRTTWAFSLIILGIFISEKRKLGIIPIILGIGLHPISIFPILVFYLFKKIKFKPLYFYSSLLIGLFIKPSLNFLFNYINIPVVGKKLETYFFGEWSVYRFHDNGEYISFYLIITLIFLMSIIISQRLFETEKYKSDLFQYHYTNFILFYFSFSMLFITFRTIELRLLLSGFIFFVPIFQYLFEDGRIFKQKFSSYVFLILWFVMIDLRILNFSNNSYVIGSGFPLNIFDSPVIRLLQNLY